MCEVTRIVCGVTRFVIRETRFACGVTRFEFVEFRGSDDYNKVWA